MSRVQQDLDILIRLAAENLEALPKAAAGIKELLRAQAALDVQRGRSEDALAKLSRLEAEIISRVENEARAIIELTNVERNALKVEQDRNAAIRQALIAGAAYAQSKGNIEQAERRLNTALRTQHITYAEAAQIQQKLVQVMERHFAASQRDRNETIQYVIAEGRAVAVGGDRARQIQILTNLLTSNTLSVKEAQRVTLALGQAQAAAAREAAAAARQQARDERDAARQLQLKQNYVRNALIQGAELAASTGAFEQAERRLNSALRITGNTYAHNADIQQRLIGVSQQRAAIAAKETATVVELTLAEARLRRAEGDTVAELKLYDAALKGVNVTEKQRIALLTARQQAENRAAVAARRDASATGDGGLLSNLKSGVSAVGTIFSGMSRVLATTVLWGFAIRTGARFIQNEIFGPLIGLGKLVLETDDEFRKFDASLLGIAGSMRAVRSLTADVATAAKGLPLTQLEALTGVRGLAYTPATARLLQDDQTGNRVENIESLLRTLVGLASIVPEQGIEGAQFAVREALAGQFRSIRTRFNVSPDVLAAGVGATQVDLKADPQLTIKALKKFVDTFVGDDAINEFNRLLSTQANRLKGSLQEFGKLIGDAGIYDRVTNITRQLADTINASIESKDPATIAAAQRINDELNAFVDSILRAADAVLSKLTGKKVNIQAGIVGGDIGALADSVTSIIELLRKFAGSLILLVPVITDSVLKLGGGPQRTGDIRVKLADNQREADEIRDRTKNLLDALQYFDRAAELTRNIKAGEGPRGVLNRLADSIVSPTEGGGATTGDAIKALLQLATEEAAKGGARSGLSYADVRDNAKQELQKNTDELADLTHEMAILGARLEILSPTLASAASPPSVNQTITADASERVKVLGNFSGYIDSSLNTLPNFREEEDSIRTFTGQIYRLNTFIKTLYSPDDPLSLTSRVKAAADRIQSLRDEVKGDVQAGTPRAEAIEKLQNAIFLVEKDASEKIQNRLLGIIRGSEGLIGQLSPTTRIAQGQGLLGFLAQTRQSQDAPTALQSSLEQATGAAGVNRNNLLDPELAPTIVANIRGIGSAMQELGASEQEVRDKTIELTDTIIEGFGKRLADAAPGSKLAEDIQVAIVAMQDLQKQAKLAADNITPVIKGMADDISSSIRGGLTDSLLDAMNNAADGVTDILKNMLISIQKAVLQTIIEFTIIRGALNGLLNSSLGLTALPTLSRQGNLFGGGRVQAFASGGLISGPIGFPLAGGQRGIAGESDQELIMPVGRNRDGDVGVKAIGGGGAKNYNIYMTVNTPNADSFRRSGKQIREQLLRAAGG